MNRDDADIFAVNNTAISQLDSLSCPIYPSEVDVEQSLNDAEGEAHGKDGLMTLLGEATKNPVENIEGAV